jgi:hypothetical protein
MLNRKIIHIHTKGGIVMTRKYLITKLIKNYFDSIVTLLDYDTQMTNQLKKITILSKKNGKVLIDALLYSGLDQYRFIEMNIDENGKIITDKYNYVILDQALEKTANDIIKKHPIQLKNSILTQSQIDQILNN